MASEQPPAPKTEPKKRGHAARRGASTGTTKKPRPAARRKSAPITVHSTDSRQAERRAALRKKQARTTTNNRTPAGGAAAPKIRPTGTSVARLRMQLKLSAAEFARRLEVTAASVYRWEATVGRLKLQARPLAALAKLQQQTRRK